jgi:hypothetical protein
MINVAYDTIEYDSDRNRVRVLPNGGGQLRRFHASSFFPQCLMQPQRLHAESTERLIAEGRPFIYSLELTSEMATMLTSGPRTLAPTLPAAVIKEIQAGRAVLFISNIEPVPLEFVAGQLWVFDFIQTLIDEKHLPPQQVWFISGWVTGLESFVDWLRARRLLEAETFRFRALAMVPSWFRALYRAAEQGWDVAYEEDVETFAITVTRKPCDRAVFAERYATPEDLAQEQRNGALRPKRFLCMNSKPRHHRQLVVTYLHGLGYAAQSLVSFPAVPVDLNGGCSSPVLTELLAQAWLALHPKLPLVIDEGPPPGVEIVPMNWVRVENGWPYRQSYFNITTETPFFDINSHVSEKLMKPAINLQPFICVGAPGTLRYWRAIGFQTFSRVFEEDYDEDVEPAVRLARIFKLIDRLAALTPTQARDLFFDCRPEVEHNRAHLIEGPHQLDRVFDELEALLG